MSTFKPKSTLDKLFEGSILLKGIDSLLQVLGGILLLLVSPAAIIHFVELITQHELSTDPHDFIANHLWHSAQHLDRGFGAFYLLSHGLVKLVLIMALLKNKLWAYPSMEVVLALFIAYQSYRFYYTHSFGIAFLTIFDLLVAWLTWEEYKKQKVLLIKD